jgi:hypothetical protein
MRASHIGVAQRLATALALGTARLAPPSRTAPNDICNQERSRARGRYEDGERNHWLLSSAKLGPRWYL